MTHPELQAPVQRAALVLHSLHDVDRAWVLDALPASQRSIIQPLLDELSQLGIPRDSELSNILPTPSISPPGAGRTSALEGLGPEGVRNLAQVLQAEPLQVTACLLGARAWAWQEELLGHFDPSSSARIRAMLPTFAAGASLQVAVLDAVQAAMPPSPVAEAARPASGWQKCKAALHVVWGQR